MYPVCDLYVSIRVTLFPLCPCASVVMYLASTYVMNSSISNFTKLSLTSQHCFSWRKKKVNFLIYPIISHFECSSFIPGDGVSVRCQFHLGLRETNSSSFPVSENVFILPLFLKDGFSGDRILGWSSIPPFFPSSVYTLRHRVTLPWYLSVPYNLCYIRQIIHITDIGVRAHTHDLGAESASSWYIVKTISTSRFVSSVLQESPLFNPEQLLPLPSSLPLHSSNSTFSGLLPAAAFQVSNSRYLKPPSAVSHQAPVP